MAHIHGGLRAPANSSPTALDDAVRAVTIESGNPLSWDDLSATATLVTTDDGRPIRTIVTGRRPITTGVYASRKAGRPLPYESMIEREFFMHCEVDTEVIDYRAQPFRLEFVMDGRKRVYIADCARLMTDGVLEVVEVKRDRRALRDPDYALKLEAVRIICERIGWRFKTVLASALRASQSLSANVLEVQSWRFTAFGQADEFAVVNTLHPGRSISLGALADVLGERALGIAKLKAMAVKRIVRLDLSKPLSPETLVELVEGPREHFQ